MQMLRYHAQRAAEWFDDLENDVNHMFWSSLSQNLNQIENLCQALKTDNVPPPTIVKTLKLCLKSPITHCRVHYKGKLQFF